MIIVLCHVYCGLMYCQNDIIITSTIDINGTAPQTQCGAIPLGYT